MSDHEEIYFSSDRPSWDFVLAEFPFPLAVTCARLQAEMERQEPVAAAWALRDAFECLIKFSASLALADFLHGRPDASASGKIAELLLKPSGLSLGDWHTLLEMALKPLAAAGELGASSHVLPALVPVFFETQVRPRPTGLNRKIDGGPDSFVAWRNRVFGHGVFSRDRGYYARETLSWLPVLGDFYDALRPVLEGRRLVSRTPGGDEVVWQGAGDLPPVPRHEHEPWGDPLPMFLAPDPGHDLPTLPLTPLLSMQQCRTCGRPAAFFFDKNKYDRKQDRHSTAFLEYFHGHPGAHRNWAETQRLATLLPPTFSWERASYDGEEVDGGLGIVFRDFDSEYLRPDYLLDAAWDVTDTQAKGYIHLTGPGGGGKTFFVRGLAAEGRERGAAVLAYHILPGARNAYQTFVSELNAYARDTLRFRTQEPQMRADTPAGMQAEFVSYLAELMRANKLDLLVVAVDALDELADPAEGAFGLTDFLPPAADLPEGCFLVLTSRDDLRPKARADVERLQRAAPGAFTRLTLETTDTGNRSLLRAYLMKHLPAALQTPDTVEALLERSGGVFLYAFHLCRALEAGVFPDVAALPDGAQFYPAYLERLRARVGDHLYETVYLPTLLLLCAAQQPVTLDQLARWGVPRDRLQFALLDLRDFLRVHRELPWQDRLGEPDGENRYEMAHEAFKRFAAEELSMATALQDAHFEIGRCAFLTYCGKWHKIDFANATELYDLRFVGTHFYHSRGDWNDYLHEDLSFVQGCIYVSQQSLENANYPLALYFLNIAEYLCHEDEANDTYDQPSVRHRWKVGIQLYKTEALIELERLPEAFTCCNTAVQELRRVISDEKLSYGFETEFSSMLYWSLMQLGHICDNTSRFDMALECYSEAEVLAQRPASTHSDESMDSDYATFGRLSGALLREQPAVALSLLEALYSDRSQRLPETELLLDNVVPRILLGMADALERLKRPTESIQHYKEVIRIYRKRANEENLGDVKYGKSLVLALLNFSKTLLNFEKFEDALLCCAEAGNICRSLHLYHNIGEKFAEVKYCEARALHALKRLPEALISMESSIELTRWENGAGGRSDVEVEFVFRLTGAGLLLTDIGNKPQAINYLREAIEMLRQANSQDKPYFAPDIVGALISLFDLCHKSGALCGITDNAHVATQLDELLFVVDNEPQNTHDAHIIDDELPELVTEQTARFTFDTYNELIGLYRWLDDKGRIEHTVALADAFMVLAQFFEEASFNGKDGDRHELICDLVSAAFRNALAIYQHLTSEDDQPEVVKAAFACASAQRRLERMEEATVALLVMASASRRVLAREWDADESISFALLLSKEGKLRREAGNVEAATSIYFEAVNSWQQFYEREPDSMVVNAINIGIVTAELVRCLNISKRFTEALDAWAKAIQVLEHTRQSANAQQENYAQLIEVLVGAYSDQAVIQTQREELKEAKKSYRLAIALSRSMVNDDYMSFAEDLMRCEALHFAISIRLADWMSAAIGVIMSFDLLSVVHDLADVKQVLLAFRELIWLINSLSNDERSSLYAIPVEQVAQWLNWPDEASAALCERFKDWPSIAEHWRQNLVVSNNSEVEADS